MCLIVSHRARSPRPCADGTYRAWKVLDYDLYEGRWITPFQYTPVKGRVLRAKGKCRIRGSVIDGGAIHCFRTASAARCAINNGFGFYSRRKRYEVFEVRGSNIVGFNATEIAFRSVEFVDDTNEWEIQQ